MQRYLRVCGFVCVAASVSCGDAKPDHPNPNFVSDQFKGPFVSGYFSRIGQCPHEAEGEPAVFTFYDVEADIVCGASLGSTCEGGAEATTVRIAVLDAEESLLDRVLTNKVVLFGYSGQNNGFEAAFETTGMPTPDCDFTGSTLLAADRGMLGYDSASVFQDGGRYCSLNTDEPLCWEALQIDELINDRLSD